MCLQTLSLNPKILWSISTHLVNMIVNVRDTVSFCPARHTVPRVLGVMGHMELHLVMTLRLNWWVNVGAEMAVSKGYKPDSLWRNFLERLYWSSRVWRIGNQHQRTMWGS